MPKSSIQQTWLVASWEFLHFFKWKQEIISKLIMVGIALVVFLWQTVKHDYTDEYKVAIKPVGELTLNSDKFVFDEVTKDLSELKEELKDAISYYFNAKARSIYAELKASRAAARLGLRILPDELQGEVGEALVGLFEKELGNLLEKAL